VIDDFENSQSGWILPEFSTLSNIFPPVYATIHMSEKPFEYRKRVPFI
jgi:hypothetical protein